MSEMGILRQWRKIERDKVLESRVAYEIRVALWYCNLSALRRPIARTNRLFWRCGIGHVLAKIVPVPHLREFFSHHNPTILHAPAKRTLRGSAFSF